MQINTMCREVSVPMVHLVFIKITVGEISGRLELTGVSAKNLVIKDNYDWINNLSLKASYGVQGNDALSSLYAWQSFYDLGYPNASMSGAVITSLENKELEMGKKCEFQCRLRNEAF